MANKDGSGKPKESLIETFKKSKTAKGIAYFLAVTGFASAVLWWVVDVPELFSGWFDRPTTFLCGQQVSSAPASIAQRRALLEYERNLDSKRADESLAADDKLNIDAEHQRVEAEFLRDLAGDSLLSPSEYPPRWKQEVRQVLSNPELRRDTTLVNAVTCIASGNSEYQEYGFKTLEVRAGNPSEPAGTARWRQLAEYAYFLDPDRSLRAYETLVDRGEPVVWDYIRLSELYAQFGRNQDAITMLRGRLNSGEYTRDYHRFVLLSSIAQLQTYLNDHDAAVATFAEASEFLGVFDPFTPPSNFEVAVTTLMLARIADLYRFRGHLPEALNAYDEVGKRYEWLAKVQDDSLHMKLNRTRALIEKAGILNRIGRTQDAIESLGVADSLLTILITFDPELVDWRRNYSDLWEKRGDAYRDQKLLGNARDSYQKAIQKSSHYLEIEPDNLFISDDLHRYQTRLAAVMLLAGQTQAAKGILVKVESDGFRLDSLSGGAFGFRERATFAGAMLDSLGS